MLRLIVSTCLAFMALCSADSPLSARATNKPTPILSGSAKQSPAEKLADRSRRLSLLVEKPLFLGSRVGTRKAGIACITSDPLFGRDFLQIQDVDFLIRHELQSAGVTIVDGSSWPNQQQVGLTISLEKIAAQLCSPSVGLFGHGDETTGKVTFTFLARQRIGLGAEQPIRAMDVIVKTGVYAAKMREEEYFPKAIHILTGWLLADWGWEGKRKSGQRSSGQ